MRRDRPRRVPLGFSDRDYHFYPPWDERILERLRKIESEWDAAEDRILKLRAKAIEASVIADRAWLNLEREREERKLQSDAELKKVQDYFNGERDKDLRAALKRITNDMNKDIVKTERKVLARRCVIRGLRS
jgi:hypothetical protein